MLLAGVERAEKTEELAGAGSQQAGFQLIKGRQQKPHDFVELSEAAGRVGRKPRAGGTKAERQAAAGLGAFQDRKRNCLVAQARPSEMGTPTLVDGRGKPFTRNGGQGHIDRF